MKNDGIPLVLRRMIDHVLLEEDETQRLVKRAQKGHRHSLATLVVHNQRLVYSIASAYAGAATTLSVLDLMQEWSIGLVVAIRCFDPRKGTKLSTYARQRIKGYVLRALSNQDRTIRYPSDMTGHLATIHKTAAALFQELRREPSRSEILAAVRLQNTNRLAGSVLEFHYTGGIVSLEDRILPNNDLGELTFGMVIADELEPSPAHVLMEKEELALKKSRMGNILAKVRRMKAPARNKRFFYMNYGLLGHRLAGLTVIAKRKNVSKQRVGQLVDSIRKRL